jgi:hypothetical protein
MKSLTVSRVQQTIQFAKAMMKVDVKDDEGCPLGREGAELERMRGEVEFPCK